MSTKQAPSKHQVVINPMMIGPASKERVNESYGVEKLKPTSKIITSQAAVKKLGTQSKTFQNSTAGGRTSTLNEPVIQST